MTKAYKIVLLKNGKYTTLYHGINRSKSLLVGKWIIAEKKMVTDCGKGEPYLSGIHIFLDKEIAEKYLKRFRSNKPRVIIECLTKGLRKKPSNSKVYLADRIKLLPPLANNLTRFIGGN